jgi:hypothetical protein
MTHVYQPGTITPTVFSLEDALHQCSSRGTIFFDSFTFFSNGSVNVNWQGACCILTSPGFFDPLLSQEWKGKKALTMLLPNECEATMEVAVLQEPLVFNLPSTDLLHNGTYAFWEVGSAPECKNVVLPYGALRTLIVGRGDEELVPVIMVAGTTVLVGAFQVTETLLGDAQAAEISSGPNWRPLRAYGDDELEAASVEAKRVGNFPWRESLFELPFGLQCFEPPVFDFRDDV